MIAYENIFHISGFIFGIFLHWIVGSTGFDESSDSEIVRSAVVSVATDTIFEGGIKPYRNNPWYWEYKGQPVMLLGGSDTDAAFQWTGTRLKEQLDLLKSVGGNYIRCVMSDRREEHVRPFRMLENGYYDLAQWNEEYFSRLKNFLEETAERDIIVHLTLWDPHDHSHKGVWGESPWNPKNNINYTDSASGLPSLKSTHAWHRFPFYTTVEDNNMVLLPLQTQFIDRILSVSLQFDHVLYNINNEGWTYIWENTQWESYWAKHIRTRVNDKGVHVNITTMRMKPEASVAAVLKAPELYSFVEISQNNQAAMGTSGQAHWDLLQELRSQIAAETGPRPLNNIKIYGGDLIVELTRNKTGTAVEAVDRFWRNILGGCASARFHRGENGWGIGLDQRAQNNILSARMLTETIDITHLEPAHDLLSDRDQNEAYCAANPGSIYVVYFPDSNIMHNFPGHGSITLDVSKMSAPVKIRWLNTGDAQWDDKIETFEGEFLPLRAPTPDHWIAVVERSG